MEPENIEATSVGDVEPVEAPAQPGEGEGMATEPITSTPTTPAPQEPEPEPEPTYVLPGQEPGFAPEQELAYFRENYGQAVQQIQQLRSELEQYELAGLDPDEQRQYRTKQEHEALMAEINQIRQERATGQWAKYLTQFAPDGYDPYQYQDPVQMQHNLLIQLHSQYLKMVQDNQTMKKALEKQKGGEPVTTGGSGAPKQTSIWSLDQTPEQLDALFRKAKMGLVP